MSTRVSLVESLIAKVQAGDVDSIPVVEDLIREGVTDDSGGRYMLVSRPAYKRHGVEHPERVEKGSYAVVTKTSVRLVGRRTFENETLGTITMCGEDGGYDRTFRIGDRVEYDSYNLHYTGIMRGVDRNGSVSVEKDEGGRRKTRLTLYEFNFRNRDLDLVRLAERNAETMMCI